MFCYRLIDRNSLFCFMTDNKWHVGLPVWCDNLLHPPGVSLTVISQAGIYTAALIHCPLHTCVFGILNYGLNRAVMKAGGCGRQLVDPHIHDLAFNPMALITRAIPVCSPQFNPDWSIPLMHFDIPEKKHRSAYSTEVVWIEIRLNSDKLNQTM